MTDREFEELGVGDVVETANGLRYIVTTTQLETKVLTRTLVVDTNPAYWQVVHKAKLEEEK